VAFAKNVICGVLVWLAFCSPLAIAADPVEKTAEEQKPDPVQKAREDKKLATRLKLFRQLAEKVQVSVEVDGKRTPVKMLPESLYRYREETRHYADAVVWAWGDGGRPKALLTLACFMTPSSRNLTYEFDSLATKPLVCTIDGEERWSPRGPGMEMKVLSGAPTPADDKAARERQIDGLLARLKATELYEEDEVADHSPEPKTFDLPWTKPVYRYSDADSGIIDGAICFACIETNPEVVLVLEAQRRKNSPPAWHYGFNRVAYAELHVCFDEKEIWTGPRLRGTSAANSYYLLGVNLGP
jgi:hypothetical protein